MLFLLKALFVGPCVTYCYCLAGTATLSEIRHKGLKVNVLVVVSVVVFYLVPCTYPCSVFNLHLGENTHELVLTTKRRQDTNED